MNVTKLNAAAALIADALNAEENAKKLAGSSTQAFKDAAQLYYSLAYRARHLAANDNGDSEFIKIVEEAILLASPGGKLVLQYDRNACKALDAESKKLRGAAQTACGVYRGRIRKYLADIETAETGKKIDPKTGDVMPEKEESEPAGETSKWQALTLAAAAFRESLGAIEDNDIPLNVRADLNAAQREWVKLLKALKINLDN